MFKKRKISELEKTEIIFDYLNDQLLILCENRDTTPEIADKISHQIVYVQEQIISFISPKLEILRTKKN